VLAPPLSSSGHSCAIKSDSTAEKKKTLEEENKKEKRKKKRQGEPKPETNTKKQGAK